ncbi:MAG: DUF4136 domain-containing protein, partial [Colwellia sp.]
MHSLKIILMLILISVIASCSHTNTKVNFDVNPNVDIKEAKTFAWLKESKAIHLSVGFNPIIKARIEEAIESEMLIKGYKIISDPRLADLALTYSIGSREKINIESYPSYYQG